MIAEYQAGAIEDILFAADNDFDIAGEPQPPHRQVIACGSDALEGGKWQKEQQAGHRAHQYDQAQKANIEDCRPQSPPQQSYQFHLQTTHFKLNGLSGFLQPLLITSLVPAEKYLPH